MAAAILDDVKELVAGGPRVLLAALADLVAVLGAAAGDKTCAKGLRRAARRAGRKAEFYLSYANTELCEGAVTFASSDGGSDDGGGGDGVVGSADDDVGDGDVVVLGGNLGGFPSTLAVFAEAVDDVASEVKALVIEGRARQSGAVRIA